MKDKISLSPFQRFSLWLDGYVKIGSRLLDGWTAPADMYAFRCPDHGLVANIVSGYKKILKCPRCWEERKIIE